MKHFAYKIGDILIVCLLLSLLSGCYSETIENPLSRQHVASVCSESNFGADLMDAEYVVLNYVYQNEEMAEKYGDSFEVEEMGDSIGTITSFLWMYKAIGKYCVKIKGDDWTVEAAKSYLGKWQVTDCYSGWESDISELSE